MTEPANLNFRGWKALICQRGDRGRDDLRGRLQRLGLTVGVRWPPQRIGADEADVVFFDADDGFDEMFDWPPGGPPPMPLVALIGSEAPGRLEWMLSRAPSATLLKPVRSTGVFASLVVAAHTHRAQCALVRSNADMKARLGARRIVFDALLATMERLSLDHEHAYALLRRRSMVLRITVEEFCTLVVRDPSLLLGGDTLPRRFDRHGAEI